MIQAGVCGFTTRARAETDGGYSVRLTIDSDCEKVGPFANELANATPLDALHEISRGHGGLLLTTAARHCKGCCSACVVPDGVFKAMQVAVGLALPAESRIELSSEN